VCVCVCVCVKVFDDEIFPADLLLCEASDPSHICYIETANLDGCVCVCVCVCVLCVCVLCVCV